MTENMVHNAALIFDKGDCDQGPQPHDTDFVSFCVTNILAVIEPHYEYTALRFTQEPLKQAYVDADSAVGKTTNFIHTKNPNQNDYMMINRLDTTNQSGLINESTKKAVTKCAEDEQSNV